ncbi:glycoside hydrolase family 9 protein [Paenibacillus silvisoli]|uniref:glycoside hydrolase family 9 protein n=1 Tax=Paenibacillus silvisoli TaxID=3110539 RepID=UPI00280513C3|nr:glycoside hydrolase family 9 protein [Paenibacillus silvisoli]
MTTTADANRRIHLNQAGYRPFDAKTFAVTGTDGGRFELIDRRNGSKVYAGELTGPIADASSGDTVFRGEFSSLREEGTYSVQVEGIGSSYPFAIAADVYNNVTDKLLKSFYFQRCGMDLEEKHAGVWSHRACHLDHGTIHGSESEERIPSSGGWHDAGDYGKYMVAAAKAVADLLLAYEFYPCVFARTIDIPESGNGVPDLLNEVRFELDFLFKLQRVDDGAVYHKVTTKSFPGLDVMPEDDTAELVFSPPSYTAAATFAAVMAMAARVYRGIDGTFAGKCLKAAELSWQWVTDHPDAAGFKNPADIHTGEYGDAILADEKLWASAELYRTTGESVYYEVFRSTLEQQKELALYELGWADTAGYGTLAYLLAGFGHERPKEADGVYERLLSGWQEQADQLLSRCSAAAEGYGISLLPEQYIWGSSMVLLNQAMHLLIAARFTGEDKYAAAALNHVHYLLGLNPLGISYVTGVGSYSVMHPHHRPSVGDGVPEPVPGMVAGGPNRNLQDEHAKKMLEGMPPAKCFVDHAYSYATNEMTIYWNSPAVFVAAYFDGAR